MVVKTYTVPIHEKNRTVVHYAFGALQSRCAVAVTGQPSIGKTWGWIMYAIKNLPYRQAAVLYLGYKSKKMFLFLPRGCVSDHGFA